MPREDGLVSDSPGVHRTLTQLWSINMSSVRSAALPLPPPALPPPALPQSATAGVASMASSIDSRQPIDFLCDPDTGAEEAEVDARENSPDVARRVQSSGERGRARGRGGSTQRAPGRTPASGVGRVKATSKPRRTTPKTKTRKRKSSGAPAPDEIDIDNTKDEQESEDVETRQDQGFIDNSSQDEEQGVHTACDNMRLDTEDAATGRPARDEPEFPSEKEKTRSERRALTALPVRGMAEAVRKVADYCYRAPYGLPTPNSLVTPYWNQQGHELMNSQLVSGAFGSEQHCTWCNDKRGQSDFAAPFFAPWDETILLRALATDIADTLLNPLACCTNSTAKLLHTIKTSHKQTELDLINGKFIQHAFVGLQHTSRELSLAMHSCPFGSIQGKANVVLWNIRHNNEVSNTSQDILNLIELIRCAQRALVCSAVCRASALLTPAFAQRGPAGDTRRRAVDEHLHAVHRALRQRQARHASRAERGTDGARVQPPQGLRAQSHPHGGRHGRESLQAFVAVSNEGRRVSRGRQNAVLTTGRLAVPQQRPERAWRAGAQRAAASCDRARAR
jgi:hypothetical protein